MMPSSAYSIPSSLWTRKFPLYADHGAVIGVYGIIDTTTIHQREERVAQLEVQLTAQHAVIVTQQAQLDELGVPIIAL